MELNDFPYVCSLRPHAKTRNFDDKCLLNITRGYISRMDIIFLEGLQLRALLE